MKLVRTLAALALVAAAPLSAFAAGATIIAPANALTFKYIFQNNTNGGYFNPFSMSVGTIPNNTSGCTWVTFANTNANYDEAKLFKDTLFEAKIIKANIQMVVDTATCGISSFQLQPN